MEVLHEGWLTKSPPEKKIKWSILKAKWRRRYFVLQEPCAAESYPGVRAALHYYKNENRSESLGSIDLTQCEEVLSSLDSPVYRHLFALRTKHKGKDRTYYLAASSEPDMNSWVDCLCQVLGLKENDDKSTESPPPPPPVTTVPPTPQQRPMLPPSVHHDTSSEASAASSPLNPSGPPLRRNSGQEAYLHLEDCFSGDAPPPTSQQLIHQVPPAPGQRHMSDSHGSIPDAIAPPPPTKTGESRNIVPPSSSSQSQIYDSPPTATYGSPKLDYVNVGNLPDDGEDDDIYKVPPSLDNNDNVYKVPPPRMDTDSLYQVPPVNHLKFVNRQDDVYKIPPARGCESSYDPGLYDVPPPAASLVNARNSISSQGSRQSHTDDSGSGDPTRSHFSTAPKPQELYDHPPPTEPRRDTYDHPPPRGGGDIYDHVPQRSTIASNRGLNEVVPVPRPLDRKYSDSCVMDRNYINLPAKQRDLQESGTVPRQHPRGPPPPPLQSLTLDDMYDFPPSSKSKGSSSSSNNLDAMPPAPHQGFNSANIAKKHKYANAPTGIVRPTRRESDSESMYLPMGSQTELYMPMTQGESTPIHSVVGGNGLNRDSYMPMTGDNNRASTDSTYTVMTDNMPAPPLPEPPRMKKVVIGDRESLVHSSFKELQYQGELGPQIVQTHRTRSFKRQLDSPPHTDVLLPKRKDTMDTGSSSDDDSELGSMELLPNRKPATSLQSRPPPPRSTGEVQYLDLDLEKDFAESEPPSVFPRSPGPSSQRHGNSSPTDYKEIDFVKTHALSEMRKDLENKRKSSEKSMDE